MAKPLAPDYHTVFLFPPALEDGVPPDHYVRFLREFVESLDLPALGFKVAEGTEGRPPYATSALLKLWLYGYVNKIFSTRQLEQAANNHLALIWLLGLLKPDHNSIWRFWRDNKAALRQVFKQSVQLAIKVGLVGFVLQAVDGTKIQAVASSQTGWEKEWMEKKLAQLNQELDQAEAQVEAQQSLTFGPEPLPEALTDRQALKQRIEAGLKELQQSEREHYHRHEPEAHRMYCEGRSRFAYNAQAVADAQSGIVTAAEVTGQETDMGQLVPMVQAAQATTGQAAACTVGDTHYGTSEDLAQAAQAGLPVLAPLCEGKPKGDNPYHASEFTYQAETDQVVCPQGQRLTFERIRKDKRGVPMRLFRCHCKDCPVRAQCSKDKRGRYIEIGPHQATVEAQRRALQDPANQAKLQRRKVIIEPVFATVKQRLGFRRWTVRGLANVAAQWALVCTGVNLLKLGSRWQKGALPMSG